MDKRRVVIPVMLLATVVLGAVLQKFPSNDSRPQEPNFQQQFQHAVALLEQRQFESAVQEFDGLMKLAPALPEAHVNMGYALLGLEKFKAAQEYFGSATTIQPLQSNAYYGLAVASEGLGEIRKAVMAMRTFVHIADRNNPYRRKANAAIREWEAALLAQKNDE